MKLEHQVCALEQAKKLKELGVEAESLWCWAMVDAAGHMKIMLSESFFNNNLMCCCSELFFAYSAAEFGVMLPESTSYNEKILFIEMDRQLNCFKFLYKEPNTTSDSYIFTGNIFEHEAHAKADLLIHLLNDGDIKPEQCKL